MQLFAQLGRSDGKDIYNTWSGISDDDRKKLGTYYERFENHVGRKANPLCGRFKFQSRVQELA